MTQRIRELLDGAVVHVEPRETDPVPVVLRRVRAHRQRAVTAGALAVVLLAAGAVVAWPAVSSLREVPTAEPVSGPAPVPRLIDGRIVAAGIRIPVPAGWTVVEGAAGCRPLEEKTVLLAGPDGSECTAAQIEIRGEPPVLHNGPGDVLISVEPLADTRLITLAGGEPGLLLHPTTSQEYRPKLESEYYNRLWLPWSQLEIKLRIDGEAQRSFLNSIRSTPRRPGKLVIGEDPVGAELIVPPGTPDRGLAGPAGIPALLELLRREDGAIDGRKACAAEEHPTAVLILAIQDRMVHGEIHALIVMTAAEECHEAVSSEGGRVRLSPEGVEELERLLGIRAP